MDKGFDLFYMNYEYLIEKYCRNLWRRKHTILKYLSYEELFQEGRIALWKVYKNYDETKNVLISTYFSTVMANEIKMILRKNNSIKAREKIQKETTLEVRHLESISSSFSIDREFEDSMSFKAYRRAIEELNEEDKLILYHVVNGLNSTEIGAIIGKKKLWTQRRIKILKSEVKERLRDNLDEEREIF